MPVATLETAGCKNHAHHIRCDSPPGESAAAWGVMRLEHAVANAHLLLKHE